MSRVIQETAECRSFELELPEAARAAFDPIPGQFVTVDVSIGGVLHERSYSLSSVAALGERPRITVKRTQGGFVSAWCNEKLALGDEIGISAPAGRFFVRRGTGPVLFAAAGSGVTPIFAMIRDILRADAVRPVTLLYVNRSPDKAIFLTQLRELRDGHPERMTLLELYSDGPADRIDRAITEYLSAHADADVYVCGPASFMERVERAAEAAEAPALRVFTERFTPEGSTEIVTATAESIASFPAADVVARLNGVEHAFACASGATLLEAALAAGLPAPCSCREGHCGACITTLREGAVDSAPGAALSRRDRLKGRILACRARPTTPAIFIDYDA